MDERLITDVSGALTEPRRHHLQGGALARLREDHARLQGLGLYYYILLLYACI